MLVDLLCLLGCVVLALLGYATCRATERIPSVVEPRGGKDDAEG